MDFRLRLGFLGCFIDFGLKFGVGIAFLWLYVNFAWIILLGFVILRGLDYLAGLWIILLDFERIMDIWLG